MKKPMLQFLCLLLVAFLLVSCASNVHDNHSTTTVTTAAPEEDSSGAAADTQGSATFSIQQTLDSISLLGKSPDDNFRVYYEIFVYSFCDSNGDGIGDLPGVISKLDYLQQLGITGIWLMPINPSHSYHKYDVDDYYAIDPDYGTMADFETLLTACHNRGIRVILDLVVNHSSCENAWFQSAATYLRTLSTDETPDSTVCPYVEYYHFSRDGGNDRHLLSGTKWYYEGQFDANMPDLNWDCDAVRDEIRDIMAYWLEKGVDGFRLDAAKEFYSGNSAAHTEVLRWIQQTATAIAPDCYLVAEVWDSITTITDYYQSGINSIFNYPFGNADGRIIKTLRGAGQAQRVSGFATALQTTDETYRASHPDYIDAPFLSNHDVGRIAGFVAKDSCQTKLAGAMNLFMGGSAFIYYGEEIGMVGSGSAPSKRAPMYWNAARDCGTTAPPPGCVLPDSYPFGSLEEQVDDVNSVYNYYRQAIAIRNAMPVISHGTVTAEEPLNVNCISAQRKCWGDESCIILYNIQSASAQVDLSAYADWELVATLSADGGAISMTDSVLSLPPYGTAILIPTN